MSRSPSTPSSAVPEATVGRWWQAMRDRDSEALRDLTLPDYVAGGGPGGRTFGRDALLAEAREFFAAAVIERVAIEDLVVRRHGDVAVCSYAWAEDGTHGGRPFSLAGVATDVLVLAGGGWRVQAHHVSMAQPPSAA